MSVCPSGRTPGGTLEGLSLGGSVGYTGAPVFAARLNGAAPARAW